MLIIGPKLFFMYWPGCPNQPRIGFSCYKYVPRLICLLICGSNALKSFILWTFGVKPLMLRIPRRYTQQKTKREGDNLLFLSPSDSKSFRGLRLSYIFISTPFPQNKNDTFFLIFTNLSNLFLWQMVLDVVHVKRTFLFLFPHF